MEVFRVPRQCQPDVPPHAVELVHQGLFGLGELVGVSGHHEIIVIDFGVSVSRAWGQNCRKHKRCVATAKKSDQGACFTKRALMKYVECKPEKASNITELPEKIQLSLLERFPGCSNVFAIKTTIKPDFHIPTVWAIVVNGILLLCSTNRPRGIWKEFELDKINAVKRSSSHALEIVWNDFDVENLHLVLPKNTDAVWTEELVDSLKRGLIG